MSQTLTAEAFAQAQVARAATYTASDDALRGVVQSGPGGEARVTVVVAKHVKNERLYLVRESAEGTQTGMPLECVGAAIRDGVIPPEVVRDLQIEGGIYAPELHAPESEPEPSEEVPA